MELVAVATFQRWSIERNRVLYSGGNQDTVKLKRIREEEYGQNEVCYECRGSLPGFRTSLKIRTGRASIEADWGNVTGLKIYGSTCTSTAPLPDRSREDQCLSIPTYLTAQGG